MPGSISGLVYTIIGTSIGIPMLIASLSVFIAGIVSYISLSALTVAVSILIPITIVALGLMAHGISLRRRARRFVRYRDAMGGAAFCTVARLADTAGETQERTKKGLKKMIGCGACPQGHLDRDETCFMVDDKTYDEYLDAEKAYAARKEAALAEEQKEQTNPKEAELTAIIKEGNQNLQQIRAANDALTGEVISQKLDRLENVTARIFACVRKHPEKVLDIRRFLRYYMPTTLKLVKSYEEFELQPVKGENITKAKEEIERALDTINTAFENLLDTLFADDVLDVSTDISTLETMLKQEGLTGSDFVKAPDDRKPS
jgi:5-bromo-4-chloroindolyl phosphate hydrolysis protein